MVLPGRLCPLSTLLESENYRMNLSSRDFQLDRAISNPCGAVIHLRGLVEKLEGIALGTADGVCSLL